jgi:hypothetical protein
LCENIEEDLKKRRKVKEVRGNERMIDRKLEDVKSPPVEA